LGHRPHGRALLCALALLVLPFGALAQGLLIPLDERAIRSTGIEWAAIEPEASAAEIRLPATVVVPPHQLRVVAAPVGGLIEAVFVAPDEPVQEGQPLARLRSTELLEAQRLFLEAVNNEALARERLARDEALYRDRVIAERRLLVTRAEHVAFRTAMEEREQMLALLGMQAEDITRLRRDRRLTDAVTIAAPGAGVALLTEAVAGQRVAQSAPLFRLAVLRPLWVNIQVPLTYVPSIAPGARVALPAQGAEGRVLRVGRRADAATQSVTAVAEIDQGSDYLRPDEAVIAVLPLTANGDGSLWRVAAGSVVRHRDRSWVFLRRPAGFEARPVRVLSESATNVTVAGHLARGDAVATRGILFLLGALVEQDGA